VGATTLALSVAWTLSEQQQRRVVLLDLDLHFGSLALSLDLEPGRGLRELLSSPDRIDSLLIDAAMTGVSERLRVLGAEEPLEDNLVLGHEGLETLLTDLATRADCVVVDLPRSLGAMTRHILRAADTIGIVTDLSLPSMRDTQRLIAMIYAIRADADVRVIVNRMGGAAGEVSRPDFERGIGAKIAFAVQFDANAAMAAAERARPFVEVARQPKTQAQLQGLALGLAGEESFAPAPPSSASFLQRLMGK
jgi:pilus assembly protein CpaE